VSNDTAGAPVGLSDDIDGCVGFLHNWQLFCDWSVRAQMKGRDEVPQILDFVDSLLEVYRDDTVSVARIGDGEFGLATGVAVPNNGCQAADESLREAMQRVLRCDNPKCRVALAKSFFYSDPSCVPQDIDDFANKIFMPQAEAGDYLKYVVPGYKYLDASMSVVRKHYPTISRKVYAAYYSVLRQVLLGKDVIVVSGDSRCFEYERNLLNDCGVNSTSYLSVPQKGAWANYDAIKKWLLDMNGSGSRLVLLGCGPTATVLAYELADTMRCLDVGHMFADYNLAFGGADLGSFWA